MQNPVILNDPTGMRPESDWPPDIWGSITDAFSGSFLGIDGAQTVEDVNTIAASGGVNNRESEEAAKRIESQDRIVEGTTKAAQEGVEALESTMPMGMEAMLLTHVMMGEYDTAGDYALENSPYLALGLLPMIPGGGGGKAVLRSFYDVVANPKALWGKSADEVGNILGEGWTKGSYGSSKTGWKFTRSTDGQSIFYHPGGGKHGGGYYGFSSGTLGKTKIVGPDYKRIKGDKATIIPIDD